MVVIFSGLALLVPAPWVRMHPLWVQFVLMLVAVGVVSVWLAWRTRWAPAACGWPSWGEAVRGFALALLAGVVMAGLAVGVSVVLGRAQVTASVGPDGYLEAALPVAALLTIAALAEELLFRGFPLARLAAVVGRVRASLALAVAFALMHLYNPDASAAGLLNVALAGLVLSAAFFGPGGIAAAWGLHLGWNGGLALGADAPVSGWNFGLPHVTYSAPERGWLTGGSFGPEGGVAATLVFGLALVVWVRLARRKVMGKEAGVG